MNRDKILKKNAIYNYIFKIVLILFTYLSVPITLKYLDNDRYGIWQTILTIITWTTLANFGIGNGLRNKITECVAKKDNQKVKKYISSAYVTLSIVSLVLFLLSIIFLNFIDVKKLFINTLITEREIKLSIFITILGFCINFIIGLSTSIAYGIHKSYLVSLSQTGSSFLSLGLIYFSNLIFNSNLIIMASIYSISNVLTNFILSSILFKEKYLKPSYRLYDKDIGNSLCKLGIHFFVLQIATMVLFSTDNFIVSMFIGVNEVTEYSIVNKFFNIINTLFSILLIQFWASVTDSYSRYDFKWIKNKIKKLVWLLVPISVAMIILVINFDYFVTLWIGESINVNSQLVLLTAIYYILLCWNGIFVNVENGMGKITIQTISYIIAAIINIPLSIVLVSKFNMGMCGVMISKIICLGISSIASPIHVWYRLREKGESYENSN